MDKDKPHTGPEAYIQRVREASQEYMQTMLEESERLRKNLASLTAENTLLEQKVKHLVEEQERTAAHKVDLQSRLTDTEEESRVFSEQYVVVEQRNADLANLFVASYRLHESVVLREVLDAIQEIAANLIGSEQVAVYGRAENKSELNLMHAFGVDPERTIAWGDGIIGKAAAEGANYINENPSIDSPQGDDDASITACIPLRVGTMVLGVIVIYSLMMQKTGLEDVDLELFDLLGTQAGTAFYCARLHERTQTRAA